MRVFLLFIFSFPLFLFSKVSTGLEEFFNKKTYLEYKNKKAAIVTNHTGINSDLISILALFDKTQDGPEINAIFFPEHGYSGAFWAEEKIDHSQSKNKKLYSLHGATRRPTKEMLEGLDVIFFDIQDIGSRSYTYVSTLFYVMEEAKKYGIEVVVFDRPNPMGGECIDGPMLETEHKSFIGYVNVPYCHGFTIGEIASFFNEEAHLHCRLKVIKMQGWSRDMSYADTGLHWIPTSPYIPESDTPFFYATTGIVGSLNIVNIGIGYTLPFKLVGAPFIDQEKFAKALNELKLEGVSFFPFSFKPFYGRYSGEICHGVKILIDDKKLYKPVKTAFSILGILKSLYPQAVEKSLNQMTKLDIEMFGKVCGSLKVLNILKEEKFPTWKLLSLYENEKKKFLEKRTSYLLY
jgi:uncharacterized protein YbbC (DUF1343 family)